MTKRIQLLRYRLDWQLGKTITPRLTRQKNRITHECTCSCQEVIAQDGSEIGKIKDLPGVSARPSSNFAVIFLIAFLCILVRADLVFLDKQSFNLVEMGGIPCD